MKVLVTGGAGFIGSNLVRALLGRGDDVRVLDNFSTGSRRNLADLEHDVEVVEGELRSYERVHNAVRGTEIVYHLGALGSVPRSVQDPLTSSEVNVEGTLNVQLAARDEGVRRVVYASSSSIYGNQAELPLRESLDILCDPAREHRVSSHYVLAEDGTLYSLVPEERTAWHAGRSHWRGREALNATSIGVEIVNLHGDKYDYPAVQIAALIELCHGIIARHPAIVPRNIVGHSDIAPQRKIDPGRRFPWARLAAAGVGLWPRAGGRPLDGKIHAALQRLGYAAPIAVPPKEIVKAFQRHFRPAQVDGMPDAETLTLLADLLDQVGGAA